MFYSSLRFSAHFLATNLFRAILIERPKKRIEILFIDMFTPETRVQQNQIKAFQLRT